MPKPPNIPAKNVRDALEKRVARQDRQPFQEMLATAMSVAPSPTAWKRFATKNPDRYTKAVQELAKMSGYVDRTEHVHIRHDAQSVAAELVKRFGQDKARAILSNMGLPASLAGPEAIEGESTPA